MTDFSKGLARVGLNPAVGDHGNLRQLLKLYRAKEEELQKTEDNQRREMKGVESYIENIRKVSAERDSITEELEAENEALKDEVKQLHQELDGRNHEMKEVLRQEQLAKEVKILKEELQEVKIKSGMKEDNLKMEHNKEIRLKEVEMEKGVQDRNEKEKKIKELEGEVKKLKLSLIIEKKRKKPIVEKSGSGYTQRDSQSDTTESKIPVLKSGKPDKNSTEKAPTMVKELTAALETEKRRKSSYEATIIKLKTLLDKNKKEIVSLKQENKDLENENQSLEQRLTDITSDAQLIKTREQALTIHNESLKEESRSVPQLYKELEQLHRQNESSLVKLQSAMLSLEEERKKCGSLERRLNETEGKWEGVVNRYKNNEQDLKTKLNQLSRELEASKDDMARSHREIMKLKAEQDRVMDNSKSESEKLRLQLLKEQEKARELKREVEKVGNIEATMEDFKKDRDVLAKELQVMISKEKANHVTATSVEVIETEKKTLKEQLNGSLKRQSDLHQDLIKLHTEHQDLKSEFTTTKENLRSTEEVVAVLRGELSRKSKELMNTFDFSREGQAKMEFEVVHLQRNIEEERKSFVKDNCDLKLMLEVEQKKNEELTRVLKEKTEEVANLRREVSRLSLNSIKLDERVQEELKQRQNVDSRNKVLEEELDKLWSQLKEVMDKHAANELSKTELEGELFRLTNLMKEHDNHKSDQLAENSAAINALGRAQQRAQAAERKIPELQEELDSTLLRLETVQTQASDLAASRKELHVLKEDQIKLKLQLQEDKVHSSLIAQQLEETQEHLKAAEEREKHLAQINSDLKHQLLTTQSELTTIGDKHKNVEDLHFVSEQGKQTLQDRAIELQTEVTRLQMELNQISNQLDNQNRKYLNLKLQTKEKMENARNIFNRQKTLLVENIQQAQNELNSVKGELEREQNDKEETKKKNQTLLTENRQLMDKMVENEESLSDQNRNISSLEYRTKFLEQENGMLQDRISSLSRQRMALEKVVREYRMEKQKEDIYKAIGNAPSGQPFTPSSGLGLSLGMPKTPFSSGIGNSVSNSLISGTDISRPGLGLLMKSVSPLAPRTNVYGNGLNTVSPRPGVESDGMSADTEGR
ncbi:uncharacterized protein [Apostichopus japonicus]|uniref:uncharacterized protein isoform X3 n=1 Tax=Stichopus japonicus TaxID=307972 RepID=UPI003AB84684